MARILFLMIFIVPLGGCYYLQAAAGQWEVIRKREPLNEVINAADTSPELAERLRIVVAARDFSIAQLGLPDNKSYRSFTDIERDFVVWNVFAAPEYSLQAKQWCFPVAGCVSYRGYFKREGAIRESERLADKGFDVAVGGVAAYSTLGKFNDPLLSTMLRWDDVQLVAVLFHELAHQVVYVKGDSGFNESFATAVEEYGVKRWLETRGQGDEYVAYQNGRELRQRLMALVATARETLRPLYASNIEEKDKAVLKRKRLEDLARDIGAELERNGRDSSGWLNGELNNARLISMTLYEGRLPAFRSLLRNCAQEVHCFYAEAQVLARLEKQERDRRLDALAKQSSVQPPAALPDPIEPAAIHH
jgi:predicted aminopeptidase